MTSSYMTSTYGNELNEMMKEFTTIYNASNLTSNTVLANDGQYSNSSDEISLLFHSHQINISNYER